MGPVDELPTSSPLMATSPMMQGLPTIPSVSTQKTGDTTHKTRTERTENNLDFLEPLQSCEQEELIVPADPNTGNLEGKWKCVATNGLEAFLKHTGVPMWQRKIALSASWPSWEFEVDGDRIKFTNHSALGDLKEEIRLDGTTYNWRDGKGNDFSSRAEWTESPDGGVLTIYRDGKLAKYYEERHLSGDTLKFTLTHGDGATWGRVFERA